MYYSGNFYNKGLGIKKLSFLIFFIIFLSGCSFNQPKIVSSATILIKTPKLKFYDKGFISKFQNFTRVEVFSAGVTVLRLDIYDNQICKDTFKCQKSNNFNNEFLHSSYEKSFLKNLFEKDEKNIIHRDKQNSILIKIKKD
ncbi:MAG: hypothetical protein ACNI3H_09315 [Halarcobacter ebronensis]|uniref:hypothetical protein n=1 Tax=Halarcobacter ebronensis TaxID=1462615 RepID=UPI003C78FC89